MLQVKVWNVFSYSMVRWLHMPPIAQTSWVELYYLWLEDCRSVIRLENMKALSSETEKWGIHKSQELKYIFTQNEQNMKQ